MTRGEKGALLALAGIGLLIYSAVYTGYISIEALTGARQSSAQDPQTNQPGYWKQFKRPHETVLRERLSAIQYDVTQERGTELAFRNEYWDSKEEGLYVDIVSGEPLFSSLDKFDSETGWPSFTRPLDPNLIVMEPDTTLGIVRTEVRSKIADSHLGHLFTDGPEPTGLRFCINSAALRFVPKERLAIEGYGEYLKLFE